MERNYDLFEVLPDDASIWKETVSGHENAIQKFKRIIEANIKRGSRDARSQQHSDCFDEGPKGATAPRCA